MSAELIARALEVGDDSDSQCDEPVEQEGVDAPVDAGHHDVSPDRGARKALMEVAV